MEDRQRDGSWFAKHEYNKGKTSQGKLQRRSQKECLNDMSSCPTSKEMVASSLQSNVAERLDSARVSQTLENCDVDSKNEAEAFFGDALFASALPYRDVSCIKRDFCDRKGIGSSEQRPLFGMESLSHKQEVREQQIQQWVLKHTICNDLLPSDCWLDKYPEASHEIPKSGEQYECGDNKQAEAGDINEASHPLLKTKLLFSDLQKASSAKSNSLLQHHHFSVGVSTDFSVDVSKSAVVRKRKLVCLKEEESKSTNICMQSELISSSKERYSDNIEVGSFCTLRQWLNQPSRVVNRHECYTIFGQILSLVHLAHSHGVVLGNVFPSSFTLSSMLQVSFLDSAEDGSLLGSIHASPSGASLQASLVNSSTDHSSIATLSRREAQLSKQATPPDTSKLQNLEYNEGKYANRKHFLSSSLIQTSATKISENLDFEAYPAGQSKKVSMSSQKRGFYEMNQLYGDSKGSRDGLKGKSMSKDYLDGEDRALTEESIHNLVQLDAQNMLHSVYAEERKWYVSPEEVSGATCSFASDIYCLGVLFFELFCSSRTREEYLETMLDLRQRILPSGMLTNQPREAAFCLWLLHPKPESRPRASELLHFEILGDDNKALEGRQTDTHVEEIEEETELLHDFLKELQRRKQGLLDKLLKVVTCLTSDINEVERRRSLLKRKAIICKGRPEDNQALSSELIQQESNDRNLPSKTRPSWKGDASEAFIRGLDMGVFKKGIEVGKESLQKQKELHPKYARLMDNFDQLEQIYLSMRSNFPSSLVNISTCSSEDANQNNAGASTASIPPLAELELQNACIIDPNSDYLGYFFDSISKYAKYSKFEVKAVMRQRDLLSCSSMICSLGFDRDQEYFATAGVSKRIKVFDCEAILNNTAEIHYPLIEMINESMLSSICWNSYIKSQIASGDYDGVVQLWDASTGQSVRQFKEHKKRTWSVDSSQTDPTKLASGSDDGSVKLWSINQGSSIETIKIKANVCCVQFSRDFGHLIAFGSADHKIYCYDLRNTGLPWHVLAGHKKAVSFVKFLDTNTLVSASTDSMLKLWDVSETHSVGETSHVPLLSYSGHTNAKNFVGLDVTDGYIACGSETNAVFAYHKSLPMPMASHKFGSIDGILGQQLEDDTGQFVSSVCWRGKSQILLVANSMGNMKVLELV